MVENMNQRFLELAKQAGLKFPSETALSPMEEKFAELIVKECLGDLKERITLRYQGDQKDRLIAYGMEIVYLDIVDNFGVEE